MASIGVILGVCGDPLARDLKRLASAVAASTHSKCDSWIDADTGVGLVACDVPTAPPSLARIGEVIVAADSRLDNSDELRSRLDIAPAEANDAALIAAAYERWGTACPEHLEGDFSFVLWDRRAKTLLAARDVLGVRPVVYSDAGGRILFASTAGAIARTLDHTPDINRELIQDFLGNRFDRWTSETAFAGIRRLPPAHAATVRRGVVTLRRYHVLGSSGAERLPRDEDYIARFRELLSRAVAARMRGGATVGVNLSGGMDSSAVAVHAVREARRSEQRVRSYTSTYPPEPKHDEEQYARSVVEMYPDIVPSFHSQESQWAFQEFRDTADQDAIDEPELTINRTVMMARLAQARRDGCHVALSGGFGDQLLTGWYTIPGILPDIGWRRLRRELPYFGRDRSTTAAVAGAIARRMAWQVPPFRGRRRRLFSAELPPPALPSQAALHAYARLTRGTASMAHLQMSQTTRAAGILVAFPYLDRRLVEFTLHLPLHLRFQEGISKVILRQAHSELPALVRDRLWGTSLWPSSQIGLMRERELIESMLTDSQLASQGLLSRADIGSLLPAFDASPETRTFQRIYRAVSVERWLRRQVPRDRLPL